MHSERRVESSDEVVTRAPRPLRRPAAGSAGTAALITLDNGFDHTKPTRSARRAWPASTPRIDRGARRARRRRSIAVTGKPFIFAVGADLTGVGAVTDREQALEIGRLGPPGLRAAERRSASRRSRSSTARPWAAASRSRCTATTARSRPASPALALPEVFLGLVPGWGGTQLLPNLIGADDAAQVDHREPAEARTRCSRARRRSSSASPTRCSSRPTSWSGRWSGRPRVVRGEVTVERPEVDRGEAWDARVARGRGIARRAAARRGARAVPRARPARAGRDRVLRRRHRRRGRGARRPRHERGAARRPLRLRPRAAPRQAPGRRAATRRWPARSPRSASSAPA